MRAISCSLMLVCRLVRVSWRKHIEKQLDDRAVVQDFGQVRLC